VHIVQVEKQARWAGQTRQTFYVSTQLQARGHDVLVVCRPGSAIGQHAKDAGLQVLDLPMKGWRLFPSALRLARRLRQERFDLLHAHGARDHLLAVIASALAGRIPVIRTKHNLTRVRRPLFYRRFASRLIAVSKAAQNVLLKAGVPQEKVTVVYDGADLQRFTPRPKEPAVLEELGLDASHFVIGTAGRLGSKSKGIPTLLRSARILMTKAPNARLLLVGRKNRQVEGLAASLGLDHHVIFSGFRRDMAATLAVMDLYVQPSVRDAFPSSVLEAMAMGKPVAATRVGGIPEAVIEGETGLLCAPENPEVLAQTILAMMNQPALLEEMGRKARARAERMFTLDRMMDEVEGVYQDVRGKANGKQR